MLSVIRRLFSEHLTSEQTNNSSNHGNKLGDGCGSKATANNGVGSIFRPSSGFQSIIRRLGAQSEGASKFYFLILFGYGFSLCLQHFKSLVEKTKQVNIHIIVSAKVGSIWILGWLVVYCGGFTCRKKTQTLELFSTFAQTHNQA